MYSYLLLFTISVANHTKTQHRDSVSSYKWKITASSMNMIRFGLAGVEIFFKLRAPTANLNEKRSSVSQLLGALVPNKIIGRHMLLCPQSLHLCQKCCNTVTQMWIRTFHKCLVFLPCNAMQARPMPSFSVHLCVRPSVCHICGFYQNE